MHPVTSENNDLTVDASLESAVAPEQQGKTTSFRWTMMALAFLIIIVNYMDRSAISYASGPIKHEFGLNDQSLGMIFSAFGVGYMIMTLGGGIFVDLWGARKVWSLSAVAWSGMTAALGIAAGFWPLAAIRMMLGITEGPCFPAMTRVVTDWLPLSERARATAFGLCAVPLASVIGAPLITTLIANIGWKAMFFVLASFGIVWSVVWFLLYRDYPENSPYVSQNELSIIREGNVVERGSDATIRAHQLDMGKTTWKFMLFNPALMANNWAFFSFGYLLFFAIHWLPEFLSHTYGQKLQTVGMLLTAPWLTAAVMLAFAGWLSDYLWRKTGSFRVSRSHLIWVCQLLSAICFLPVVMVHSLPVAMVFLSLGLGFGLMPNACFYALNSDLAGDRAATSLGLMDCVCATAAILAPWLTGHLVDVTGDFRAAILLMMGFTLTSVVAVFAFQHPDRFINKAADAS